MKYTFAFLALLFCAIANGQPFKFKIQDDGR